MLMSFRSDRLPGPASRFALEPLESRTLMAVGPAVVWGGVPWQTGPALVVSLDPGAPAAAPPVAAEPPTLGEAPAGEVPAEEAPVGETPTGELPPPTTPLPDPLALVGRSPLGGNLNVQSDRVQDLPFTDLVKTTRGFYNLAGRVASNGKPAFANTDSSGWPTEDFTFSAADNAEYGVQITPGTYR